MEKFYSCSIESPIADYCTMYVDGKKTLGIIQQRYSPKTKHTWWGPVDRSIADDIFTHSGFPEYFEDNTGKIVEVRKVMWALRMPKMPKQAWETRF